MSKTIAILGASGNVGSIAAEHFAKKGDEVIAYGRREPQFNDSRITNQSIDYDNYNELLRVFKNADVVIILIGFEYKFKVWKEKWPEFANKLNTIIKTTKTRTIFFDNVYPYGYVLGKMTENTKLKPSSRKGEIRTIVDNILLRLESQGYPVVIARAADFYGPGVTTSLMSERFHSLIEKQGVFEWLGDPSKVHTFTFLPDTAPALYSLAHSDSTGVYHLPTTNEPMSGDTIKKVLEEITGKQLKSRSISRRMTSLMGIFMSIMKEITEMMYQYENHYIFDSSKIQKEFPKLKTTPYKEGITLQYKHYNQ